MDNKKRRRSFLDTDPLALMEQYQKSLENVNSGDPAREPSAPAASSAPKSSDELDSEEVIRKIRDKNKRREQSIWTDAPVLKPEKSVWRDESDAPAPKRTVKPSASGSNAVDFFAGVNLAQDHVSERKPAHAAEKRLIDKPKTELTMQVSEDGSSSVIKSDSKKTVTLGIGGNAPSGRTPERAPRRVPERAPERRPERAPGKKSKVKLDVQEKQFDNRRASRQELSINIPVSNAASVSGAVAPKPNLAQSVQPVAEAQRIIDAGKQRAQKENAARADSADEERRRADEERMRAAAEERMRAEDERKAAEAEAVRREMEERAARDARAEAEYLAMAKLREEQEAKEREAKQIEEFERQRAEIRNAREKGLSYQIGEVNEQQIEKDLEKYEKIREQTLKKQQERQKLSKTGRNDFEFSFVNAAVCLTVLFSIAIALLVMNRESGFINSENRNLATFPEFSVKSWFSGEFAKGVDDYYTDTIPYRESLKKAGAQFTEYFGVKDDGVVVKGKMKKVKKEKLDEEKVATTTTVTAFTGKVTTTTTKKGETTTTASTKKTEKEEIVEVPDNMDDVNWEGNVIVVGSGSNVRAVDAYYGSFDIGKQYAQCINKWKNDLGDGVNVYNMTIPTASAYYLPEKFRENVSDQKDNIININSNLKGIIGVDIYDTLDDHKKEYIYSRTDHHWQPLGAYYAMKVFAEQAGIEYPELSTYDEWKIENFVGTMYAYSDYDPQIAANPDTFIYYKPDNDYTVTYYDTAFQNPNTNDGLFFDYAEGVNCYSAILNMDTEIAEIDTDCDNGRVLVIFKDSFGNATVPFLTHGFSKIYVCDFRYFDINAIDFCKQVGCTDLLFAISITSASTDFKIDQLNNIRIQ